jgi:hypothetical protein
MPEKRRRLGRSLGRLRLDGHPAHRARRRALEPLVQTLLVQPMRAIRQLQHLIQRFVLCTRVPIILVLVPILSFIVGAAKEVTHVVKTDRTPLVAVCGCPVLVEGCVHASDDVLGRRTGLHVSQHRRQRDQPLIRLIEVFISL